MIKGAFALISFLFITISAICQTGDTTVSYFKNYPGFLPKKVITADSADFVRIVYPDSGSNLYSIIEYYANGKKKFIGKTEQRPGDIYLPKIIGDCIGFFPNGKRKFTAHYDDDKILGLEYFFYPNGQLYAVKKWFYNNAIYNSEMNWECYDENGNKICENGNGSWLIYDDDFSNIVFSGEVKKGLMNGEWQGYDILEDTIKYTCKYNGGALTSGLGYDKKGTAHQFKKFIVSTTYNRGGLFVFLDDLNRHLVLPKDAKGKKINIDSAYISFVIEKDGRLSELKLIGNTNDQLQTALDDAVKKCGEWLPIMYYGIPYRSFFVTSLKPKFHDDGGIRFKTVDFKGMAINSIKTGNADSAQP